MIKYEGYENKYYYDNQKIQDILNFIKNVLYNPLNRSKENISKLLEYIDSFMSTIKCIAEKAELFKRETEDEARDYFGIEFIKEFENIIEILNNQKTKLFIHGTSLDNCPSICENGLMYDRPNILSTAVPQPMTKEYGSYETLLNWPHREWKGLVLIAVPDECFTKFGLWNHFRNLKIMGYTSQNYKIDSEFIFGYIDVINKKIIRNPKYNRQHNYDNYKKDLDVFGKIDESRDDHILPDLSKYTENIIEESNDKKIHNAILELELFFSSLTSFVDNGINEIAYNDIMKNINLQIDIIKNNLQFIKTNEEIEEESKTVEKDMQIGEENFFEDYDFPSLDDEDIGLGR